MKAIRIYDLLALLLLLAFPSCAIIEINELLGLPRKTKERDVPKELDGEFYFFEDGRLTKVMNDL